MPTPRCSLVVPVYNGLDYLGPMLESLFTHIGDEACEVILSDDGSDEATRAFLKAQESRARVLLAPENRGFAAACNAGAQAAGGKYQVFLNTDLEFRRGWLERLVAVAESDPTIGAVGCRLLYPDGTIQHGGVFLREDRLDRISLIASHDHVGKPGDDPEANRPADLLAVTAAAILVRQEAFQAAGGFDEGYINGYEDVDLCLALGSLGWKVRYEPSVELVHHESKSGAKRFAHTKPNQRRFVAKWQGKVRPEVLVTPYYEVLPHPDARNGEFFRPVESTRSDPNGVCVWVEVGSSLAAASLTIESVLASRLGLGDAVVATCLPEDLDAQRFFALCEAYDDAFSWRCGVNGLSDLCDVSQEVVAFLRPGTVVTQGWLSRMLPWLEREDVGAVGPMLSNTSGPQSAMACFAEGQSGTYFPNELTRAFCDAFREQGLPVNRIAPDCLLVRTQTVREAVREGASSLESIQDFVIGRGERLVVCKDVYVHFDGRFEPQGWRKAA